MERVVITGLGVVSAVGCGIEEFWNSIAAGKDGISRIERFDASPYRSDMGGEVKNFKPYLKNLSPVEAGLVSQYAASAARMAFDDAAAGEIADIYTADVIIGTSMGEGEELKKAKYSDKAGLAMRLAAAHSIAASVCEELQTEGDAVILPNACTAGNYAIIDAYSRIKSGKVKYAFAGGADMLLEVAHLGFSKLRALSPGKCRPFDAERNGMAAGEGAAVLFMETFDSAVSRGADIYAEIIGWGASCDAYSMVMPQPNGDGIRRAMAEAVSDAGISYDEVDYICAHGTGTQTNDRAEAEAIRALFGREVPVSSIKSATGHAMGAASAMEAAVCCMAIKTGIIPHTVNLADKDEECDVDCVLNTARRAEVRVAVNNASAFGGANSSVIFKGTD